MSTSFERVDAYRWRIPRRGKMQVPGLVYASEAMIASIRDDQSPAQVANVAQLPGIVSHSIAMPDVHWGYGFPIGGVAAFDERRGVLSPGGVGYDINCGVRLLRSSVLRAEVLGRLEEIATALYRAIPAGVGSHGALTLSARELDDVLVKGAAWAVERGLGDRADLEVVEEGGRMVGANPDVVSARAKERGRGQLGSLGSGNHFCELGYVAEIYDPDAAAAFGLGEGEVTLLIHSGSRGLGYQVCDDSLRTMLEAARRYGIDLPDRQLCAAPLDSKEAQGYFAAMACAINFAFANRQVMTHRAREALCQLLGASEHDLGLRLVYDVCHNIAKWETHTVEGRERRLCVHRKGATRALPARHPALPAVYADVGQPVLIPGDMGRYSYVLVGEPGGAAEAFASCCHGAGRVMSRAAAKKLARGRPLFQELRGRGIFVRSDSQGTVAEEISEAYKDVADVVEVVCGAGLARKVAKLVPMAVIKG
jgi:tRNA-splicing ligase RtcB